MALDCQLTGLVCVWGGGVRETETDIETETERGTFK